MNELFLRPSPSIDSDHPAILAALDRLQVDDKSPIERAIALFAFVRDEIPFQTMPPMRREEDYRASVILERGSGFCIQKAGLLAALCRAAGIPCQVCFADIRNHRASQEILDLVGTNEFVYHGYDLLWLEGRWVKATPTFDRGLCDRTETVLVEFDGVHDAMLPALDRQGRKHIEYLRHIGCYSDIPVQEILAAFWTRYVRDTPRLRALWEEGASPLSGP